MLVVQGRLAPEDGAALMRALERAAESVPADTQELGAAAVRAQALVGLATGGSQDVELVVHVDAHTLAAEETVQQAELEGGPALAPETVRRLGAMRLQTTSISSVCLQGQVYRRVVTARRL